MNVLHTLYVCSVVLANAPSAYAGPPMLGVANSPAPWVAPVQDPLKGCKIEDMHGPAGTQIKFSAIIFPGSEGKSGTFFLRGLPDRAFITEGVKVNGVWAVPSKDLEEAAIFLPASLAGRFDLFLQCIIGGEHFENSASLTIEATPLQMKLGAPPAEPIPPVVNQAQNLNSHPLMKQADDLLQAGDIARARLLYEYLAMKGSPRAAFSLGGTYDPAYLNSIYVRGISPDIALAKRWYRLAEELGVPEARNKLSELGK
jgi:hypothetical protein